MSFAPEDLEEIQHATGLDELEIIGNTEFENEYMEWRLLYHRTGGQGPLPMHSMMIPLLRMCGIKAKAPKKTEIRFDWSTAPLGMQVLVNAQHGSFLGAYVGMVEIGSIAVRIGADPYIHEFTPAFITPAPKVLPAGVQLNWVEPADGAVPVADESYAKQAAKEAAAKARLVRLQETGEDAPEADPADKIPAETFESGDRADPTGNGPHNRQAMLLLNAGDAVLYELDGDYVDAQFMLEGPGDGQVTIFYEGRELIVSDALVEPANEKV